MVWLKCCPRCDGDLYRGTDHYGDYLACLQCGRYLTEAEEVVVRYILNLRMPVPGRKDSFISMKSPESA
jgi:hypothetical protein